MRQQLLQVQSNTKETKDINKITKQKPIMIRIKKKQLNWYGHLVRMMTDKIARKWEDGIAQEMDRAD